MGFKEHLAAYVDTDEDRRDKVGRAVGEALDQADQLGQQIITMMAKFHHAASEVERDESGVFGDQEKAALQAAIAARIASLAGKIATAAANDPSGTTPGKLKERYQALFGAVSQTLAE